MFFNEIYAYDSLVILAGLFCLPEAFFPWNLDFSNIFLQGLGGSWEGGSWVNLTSFEGGNLLNFLSLLNVGTFNENSSLMSLERDLLLIFIFKVSYPPLNKEKMNLKMVWPKLFRKGIYSFLLFLSFLFLMKSEIHIREILILLTSISWVLLCPNIKIKLAWLSHKSRLPSWSSA